MAYLFPTTVDVSPKGQVLIPAVFRRALGIKPRTYVILLPLPEKKSLILEPIADPIDAACGLFAAKDSQSWTKELLLERKKDLKWEEKGR